MMLLLFSCFLHKTDLTGVVDHVGKKACTVEISTGEVIVINSKFCNSVKEGDTIYFYVKKK